LDLSFVNPLELVLEIFTFLYLVFNFCFVYYWNLFYYCALFSWQCLAILASIIIIVNGDSEIEGQPIKVSAIAITMIDIVRIVIFVETCCLIIVGLVAMITMVISFVVIEIVMGSI